MQWSLVKFLLYKISYLFTKNKNKNSYAILLIITTTIVIYKNMFNIKLFLPIFSVIHQLNEQFDE